MDPIEDGDGVDLVVDRVEDEHDIEGLVDGERGGVADVERDIGELGAGGFSPGSSDGAFVEVISRET